MEKTGFTFIILAAVAILIGLSFWGLIGTNVSTMSAIQNSPNNVTFLPANSGTAKELTVCQQKVSTITVFNSTTNEVPATNYTITQAAGANGYLAAFITSNNAAYNGATWKVTCAYQGYGYVNEGGSRSVVVLIPVGLAILIMIAAMPDVREWIKGFF